MRRTILLILLSLLALAPAAFGQANGNLQIHFMDVGQGDGAVLISPRGEVVLFDSGAAGNCDRPVSYLQQLGVTRVDYHIASHYHSDHIGCAAQVLGEFPLRKQAIDRGGSYTSPSFEAYLAALVASPSGVARRTATPGMTITLDEGSPNPVVIKIVAVNARGLKGSAIDTTNENDLSVAAKVTFGRFDAEIGGDLSGFDTEYYEDIETPVSEGVGQVEVYKVHHHGSRYSSNRAWLEKIKPKVGIISVGNGNDYGHPTEECLERLHFFGVKTYWTERGRGAAPVPGQDTVGGNIIVESAPGSSNFTVTYRGTQTDTYSVWGSGSDAQPPAVPKFAWSKRSEVYHYATCRYVENINPNNLEKGQTPPAGKRLHKNCPVN